LVNSFDVAAWVKTHVIESDKQKSSTSRGDLKIAGSDPNKKEDEGVGIMMAMDKDETTRRQERAAEAELKRQQNALPAWHLKSTITGDLTALGIQEHARAEAAAAAAAAVAATGSNDDILKGLGVVGGSSSSSSRVNAVVEQSLRINGFEEQKPIVGREEADCESISSDSTDVTYPSCRL
jgi:transcription initiation factor TFIIE subunit alpha